MINCQYNSACSIFLPETAVSAAQNVFVELLPENFMGRFLYKNATHRLTWSDVETVCVTVFGEAWLGLPNLSATVITTRDLAAKLFNDPIAMYSEVDNGGVVNPGFYICAGQASAVESADDLDIDIDDALGGGGELNPGL